MVEWKTILAGGLIGLFVFLIVALITQGAYALMQTVFALIIFLAVLGFLILVAYLIYYWKFKHHSPQFTKLVQKDIMDSGRLSKSPYIRDLWLRGDEEHQAVNIGRIIGHTQIPRLIILGKDFLEITDKQLKKLQKEGIKKLLINETYFGVKRHGLRNIFRSSDTVVAIEDAWSIKEKDGKIIEKKYLPEMKQHSRLLGNVDLRGPALNRVGEYFYLPFYASSPMIDQVQTLDVLRKHSHYVLNELGTITDKSLGSNVALQIQLETQKLIDAQRLSGEKK
jgi:hypothetical protein